MQLYITDKTGKRFWNTDVSVGYAHGERNNLKRHLQAIKAGRAGYQFIDAATARLVEESPQSDCTMSVDELLDALAS